METESSIASETTRVRRRPIPLLGEGEKRDHIAYNLSRKTSESCVARKIICKPLPRWIA